MLRSSILLPEIRAGASAENMTKTEKCVHLFFIEDGNIEDAAQFWGKIRGPHFCNRGRRRPNFCQKNIKDASPAQF